MSGSTAEGGAVSARAPLRPRRADVTASYDLGVERYEELWSPVILPAAEALVPLLELSSESVVLDVGGGTGALSGAIRSAASAARVVVIDASIEMLRVAKGRRAVPAVQADAVLLPTAGAVADAVVLAYVLFHHPDPLAALEEATRSLRPAGRVGTVTWASERDEGAYRVWDDALAEAGAPTPPLRRVDVGLDSPEAVRSLLDAAGLVPERVWRHHLSRQWGPQSFWNLLAGSGAQRQRLDLIDPQTRCDLLADVRARFDELPPEDFWWEGEVICAVARKPDAERGVGSGSR